MRIVIDSLTKCYWE